MWAKVKSVLRRAKARTQQELCDAIAAALAQVTPSDTHGFFGRSVVGVIT
jgi:hypothetical protein